MRARTVLLLLILLPAVAPAQEDTKQADAELEALVNAAIDRGAKWLVTQQDWNGSFPGVYAASYPLGSSSLPLLALLHSGVSRESQPVRRGLAWLRAMWRSRGPEQQRTYGVSVAVMALVESGRREDGTVVLPEEDRTILKEMVDYLVKAQDRSGVWWYGPGMNGHDHSNSQYALLALKEARRAGAEVSDDVFLAALKHFLATQETDGPRVRRYDERGGDGVYSATREATSAFDLARGWGYIGPARGTSGSMTAAGVAAVTICATELTGHRHEKLVERAEQSARDGLAWLGRNFTVTGNPPVSNSWHYYYLYGLERAGVLARVVYMGGHRWYAEGARHLVDAQGPDGGWRPLGAFGGQAGQPPNTVDQSFALLFLSRSTARALGVATEKPLADLTSGDGLGDEDFAALFAVALEEMATLRPARVEKRAREFALLGPRVLPLLLRRLSAGAAAERDRAVTILRAITGESFGFDPAGEADAREAAADRWTAWSLARRGTTADPRRSASSPAPRTRSGATSARG